MNRNELFALKFENESLKISAAGFEDKVVDFVLYGKDDDEYCGDGDNSAEFVLNLTDAKLIVSVFKSGLTNQNDLFENKSISISYKEDDHLFLEVTDSYERKTELTIFDTDADLLLKALIWWIAAIN